jgi:hypothetical protein
MATIYTLVSAVPGDLIPGTELGGPDCPLEWADLPESAQKWAAGRGYGLDDPEELVYVLTEGDGVPPGFESYRFDLDRRPAAMAITNVTELVNLALEDRPYTAAEQQAIRDFVAHQQAIDEAVREHVAAHPPEHEVCEGAQWLDPYPSMPSEPHTNYTVNVDGGRARAGHVSQFGDQWVGYYYDDTQPRWPVRDNQLDAVIDVLTEDVRRRVGI